MQEHAIEEKDHEQERRPEPKHSVKDSQRHLRNAKPAILQQHIGNHKAAHKEESIDRQHPTLNKQKEWQLKKIRKVGGIRSNSEMKKVLMTKYHPQNGKCFHPIKNIKIVLFLFEYFE